jgi:hypothetical protein
MKKLFDYIARKVWNEIGSDLTEGIATETSLKAVYAILSEDFGEEFAEQYIKSLLEANGVDGDEPTPGDEKELENEKWGMMTQGEKDAYKEKKKSQEELDEAKGGVQSVLNSKVTNPDTGRQIKVSSGLSYDNNTGGYQAAKSKMKDAGVSDDEIEKQSDSETDTPTESGVDRIEFDKKDKKHKDNPNGPTRKEILDNLNTGNLDILSEYQDGVAQNREKGIAGAGGPVASEGESKYCSAVDTDFDKWDSDNKDAISEKEKEFDRKRTADEFRTARALGLDPKSVAFNNYLAKREVWSNQQLDKLKADKDSVFYKNFKGNDTEYKDWMAAAYDGARTTQRTLKDTSIDTSKPYKTIQSTAEVDQAVEAHLEDSVKNAKSSEDKKHTETQLKNFKKFKGYHDTYVVGKDENGRTTYMGISNKKDDQIRDPQNNTTPKNRFKELEKTYGKEVAEGVTKSLEENIDRVSNVQQNTVKTASNMEVTDDFVSVCETKEMKKYMDDLKGRKDMKKYLIDKGMDITKLSNKELLVEMNNKAKDLIESGKDVPYIPYGKIAIKVGEFSKKDKFKKQYPSINFDDSSVVGSVDIKQKEQSVVSDSHTSLVSDLVESDKPDGYSKDNTDADNGPHQQGYIGGVLDACHIDTYIDMDSDDGMLLQMGINGVKPSMIRECVAERSGFAGDSTTSEGKQQLKDHLRKRCRVTPGGDRITIKGSDGKDTDLFEDSWRTAGTGQKVASGFGKSMRTCLQSKASN